MNNPKISTQSPYFFQNSDNNTQNSRTSLNKSRFSICQTQIQTNPKNQEVKNKNRKHQKHKKTQTPRFSTCPKIQGISKRSNNVRNLRKVHGCHHDFGSSERGLAIHENI